MSEIASPAEISRVAKAALAATETQAERLAVQERAVADLRRSLAEQSRIGEIDRVPAGVGNDDERVARTYIEGDEGSRVVRWQSVEKTVRTEDGEIERSIPGLLDTKPTSEWQAELQYAVHQRTLARAVVGRRAAARGSSVVRTPLADAQVIDLLRVAPKAIRDTAQVQRLFSDASGAGAEWIPDTTAPVLWETLKGARLLGASIQEVMVNAKNVAYPFLSTGLRPYLKAASTSSTDDPAAYVKSTLSTTQRSFVVTGMSVAAQIDEDATEDSVIDWSSIYDREVVAAIRDGEEDAIVNGDTAGTHQDAIASWNIRGRWGAAGLGGSADHRRACIGLRARAFDVSNAVAGANTAAGILTGMGTLDSPMAMSDLILVTSIEKYIGLLGAAEVETMDTFGPNATIATGQLARIYGIPVVVSEFMSADLAASGLYTGSGALSGFILFNRSRFVRLMRRGARIESAKDITRGVLNIVSTVRETPIVTMDSSTAKNVYNAINI